MTQHFTLTEIIGLYRENREPRHRAWFRAHYRGLAMEFDAIEREERRQRRMEAHACPR